MVNYAKKFTRKLKARFDQKQNEMERLPATLGDGAGNLVASEGFVYCLISGQIAVVYNNRVANQIGLAVWVGRTTEEPNLFQILSTRSATPAGIDNGYQGGYAPAKRYEWHAVGGGQDPLAVHLRAITFLRLGVSSTPNTASTLYADLRRGFVHTATGFKSIAAQDINLFSQIPSTANKAAMVLITIDQNGAVIQTKGSEVNISALTVADIPEPPAGTAFLCGAIRVYNGQTAIQEGRTNTDIWDGRLSWLASNGGGGNFEFPVDGRLAVSTNVPNAIVVTKETVISEVYAYVKTTGSASSTIVDINKNGTTIYTTQANRPTIAYNDANGWVNTTPDILTFEAGDIITLDIDQVATGAGDLVVVLSVAGSSGGGASSGIATIPVLNATAPSTSRTTTSSSYADISAAEFDVTLTKVTSGTDILVDLRMTAISTGANTRQVTAVATGGTDYEVISFDHNTANVHASFSALLRITGLSTGSHTFRPRWKRTLGAGTVTMNTDDRISMSFQEVA